jgi:hypothetical protein
LDRASGERQALSARLIGLPTALIDIVFPSCCGRSGGDRSTRAIRLAYCTSEDDTSLADAEKKAHGVGMIAGQEAAR